MSGGGNKGAYESGVIYGLAHNLPSEKVAWDVVTGVSAGAINTAGLSMFPVGKEKEASEFLVDTIEHLHTDNIYKFWSGGIEESLFNQSGIVDT